MIVLSLYPNDVRVRREAEALARSGVAVDVICLRDDQQAHVEEFGLVTAYRIIRQRSKESLGSYVMLAGYFTAAAFVKLQTLSLNRRYDVIQAHSMPDFLIFAGLLHKLLRRRLVLDLHDLSVELFRTKWGGKWPRLMSLVSGIERLSCGFADRLITTSQGFQEKLIERRIPEDKITLVLNTPDPNLFPYQVDRNFDPIAEGVRLLYHGTVAERFGLETAIEAVALLQRDIPGATLNIFGPYDSNYRVRLEQQIQNLNVRDFVRLEGSRTLEEIQLIIRRSDIGVAPYWSNEFMDLALSTKAFEYAASGLPIVASRLKPFTSIFDDQSIRFARAQDAEDLAQAIVALCRCPSRRRAQADRARHALDEISGAVMADRYVNLIKGLINTGA